MSKMSDLNKDKVLKIIAGDCSIKPDKVIFVTFKAMARIEPLILDITRYTGPKDVYLVNRILATFCDIILMSKTDGTGYEVIVEEKDYKKIINFKKNILNESKLIIKNTKINCETLKSFHSKTKDERIHVCRSLEGKVNPTLPRALTIDFLGEEYHKDFEEYLIKRFDSIIEHYQGVVDSLEKDLKGSK